MACGDGGIDDVHPATTTAMKSTSAQAGHRACIFTDLLSGIKIHPFSYFPGAFRSITGCDRNAPVSPEDNRSRFLGEWNRNLHCLQNS